jgi:N-acetylmuramoyl-L-alanine amidase
VFTNDGLNTITEIVNDSDNREVDCHVALHSDAENSGTVRGTTAFACDNSVNGQKLAKYLYNQVSAITPVEDRNIKDGAWIQEVRQTDAPACLMEVDFHSTLDGAEWIINNISNIAEAVSRGILQYLGISYQQENNCGINIKYGSNVVTLEELSKQLGKVVLWDEASKTLIFS